MFRYHNNCHKRFTNPKEIKSAQGNVQELSDQSSLAYVLRSIKNEPERIWTSTELNEIYITKGGSETHRTRFLRSLEEILGTNYCILKSPGIAAICMHRDKAASIFKVTSVTDDPEEEMINKVTKMIKADIAKIKHNTSTYSSLNKDTLYENSSVTLSCLLSEISPKLRGSLAGIMINHIVTSVTSDNFSMLQLALALLVRYKREINF